MKLTASKLSELDEEYSRKVDDHNQLKEDYDQKVDAIMSKLLTLSESRRNGIDRLNSVIIIKTRQGLLPFST